MRVNFDLKGRELSSSNSYFELDFGYQFIFDSDDSDISESIYNTDFYNKVESKYAYSLDNESFSDWNDDFSEMIHSIDDFQNKKLYIRARYDLDSTLSTKNPKIGVISIDCKNVFDVKFSPSFTCPKIAEKQKLICYSVVSCETPMKIDTTQMESAMGNLQNMLNNNLIVGYNSMEVKYFKTSPDTKTTDHIMNEYGILNVVAVGTISIILEGNKVDTQALEISPYGINFSSLTTFIPKGHFANVFGVNSRPQNGDIVVFEKYYNRILEVASADIEPGVGDTPNSYNVSLVKYNRNKNVLADPETQSILDAMIPEDIDISQIASNIDEFKSSNLRNYDESDGDMNQRSEIDDGVIINSFDSYDLSESESRFAVSYEWQPSDSEDVTINVSYEPVYPDVKNSEFEIVEVYDEYITLDTDVSYYGVEVGSFIYNDNVIIYVTGIDDNKIFISNTSVVESGDTLSSLPNNDLFSCGDIIVSTMYGCESYSDSVFIVSVTGDILFSFNMGNQRSKGDYSSTLSVNNKYNYIDLSSNGSYVARFTINDTFNLGKISLLRSNAGITGMYVFNKSISQADHSSINKSAKNYDNTSKVVDDRVNVYFSTTKRGVR